MDAVTTIACVGLGSNLDQPERQVRRAIDLLRGLPRSRLVAVSSLYRSKPFGPVEQPDFINAAAALETGLGPKSLLESLQAVERAMGRQPAGRWGPRLIDLDLLIYGEEVIETAGLQVPHPGIAERNFVLLPLMEIVPELVVPGLGRIRDIAVNDSEPRITRLTGNH